MRVRSKIWLGVGTFVVIGTGASGGGPFAAETLPGLGALHAPATETALPRIHFGRITVAQHADHPDQKKEAGEGNEAKGLASLPPELAFAVRIALIRGHLLVGDELVKQQQWNAALPHFLHPGEEIYGDIKEALARQGAEVNSAGPDQFAAIIRADLAKWNRVVRDADIKLD